MNTELVKELVKYLETRKKQLLGETDLGYKVHQGHHLKDVFTVLAVLKDNPKAKQLVNNLPKKA